MSNTRLSVNVNKIALWRNARGGNLPDLSQVVLDCERFGAQGITVHPRPDQRHIRRDDLYRLRELVRTEFNVEGYPSEEFLRLMEEIRPHQVTLVPDAPDALTSSEGWDAVANQSFLTEVVARLKAANCRTSLFLEPNKDLVDAAFQTGTDCIEFYTGPYAANYHIEAERSIKAYRYAAIHAGKLGLCINAGHDLNLDNLGYWCARIPQTHEVSIGHALWADALYMGMENTIQLYLRTIGTAEMRFPTMHLPPGY